MRTGAPWHDMPNRYPPYQTCHRRFQEWVRSGTFEKALKKLVEDVKERGDLDLTECFIDGTFVMAVADGAGFPVALSVGSASPHEVRLVENTLGKRLVEEKPERLIGDRAYDSDPLDKKLTEQGILLISPHKSNRKKPKTQDGRALRRYRRRWKVERLFAWLQNYRCILVRNDRFLEITSLSFIWLVS